MIELNILILCFLHFMYTSIHQHVLIMLLLSLGANGITQTTLAYFLTAIFDFFWGNIPRIFLEYF
jgi:hypothetical protein